MILSYNKAANLAPEQMKAWIVSTCDCPEATANQALNDVVNDRHKATPWTCVVGGVTRKILHCSAGKSGTGKTCTIFFVEYPADFCEVVALGKHKSSASYTLTYVKSVWGGRHVGEVVDLESA